MISPLRREDSFEDQIFVVAVPLKPYYNPVNLEKDGTRVKHKKLIGRISVAQAGAHAAHQRSGAARGHFLLGAARLGNPGAGLAAAHREPLPALYGSGCAPAAARHIPAPRPRP